MEQSRTMENMEIGNGAVRHNGKYGILGMERSRAMKKWELGLEWSRTMKKMGYGNGTIPNNGKNGIREWDDPEQ